MIELFKYIMFVISCCFLAIAVFFVTNNPKETKFTDFEKKLQVQIDKRDSLITILLKNELVLTTALEAVTSSFPEQHLPENDGNDVLTHFVFNDIKGKPHKFHVYIPKGK